MVYIRLIWQKIIVNGAIWIMEELKDVSIHHTALKILSEITSSKNYDETIYKTVQVIHCQVFSIVYD